MDIYAKTVKLNDKDFKEIIGVKRTTFEAMVTILKKAYAARPNKHRGGRKKKLSIEEQLILTLKYERYYVTQKALAFEFEVGEATVSGTIKWVENTLIKDGSFYAYYFFEIFIIQFNCLRINVHFITLLYNNTF